MLVLILEFLLHTLRDRHPIRPDLNDTIEFLISAFHAGEGYSSINTAHPVLSALIEPINGLTLGKQPIIHRYMREYLTFVHLY